MEAAQTSKIPPSPPPLNISLPFGIRTPSQLQERCKQLGSTEFVIEDLLPKKSLGLLVGGSGLGKSPLMYQAAMCVAAGIPFLGNSVKQGPVLYLDCENGIGDVQRITTQLAKYLGLGGPPENLLLWNLNDCEPGYTLEKLIGSCHPVLVIVDPLYGFYPSIESEAQKVTEAYQRLRKLMADEHCSIIGIHHIKKPGEKKPGEKPVSLESHPREWFLQARGSSVLINGSDVRLGIHNTSQRSTLTLGGFSRVRGSLPIIQLGRVLDMDGEPVGFQQMCGLDLIDNTSQKETYNRLPPTFRFKDAKEAYGKADQATNDFLSKCISAGIVRKLPENKGYLKVEDSSGETEAKPKAA